MPPDGLNQGTVDDVDDDAQKQNDGVLGHSRAERVPSGLRTRRVDAQRG